MGDVKNLHELLGDELKSRNAHIVSYKSKNLIGPGENYGSIMLALDVELEGDNGEKQDLQLVAKLLPPTEFMKTIFNITVTFKKEVEIYKTVVPALQEFQRERGCKKVIDFFPKYMGSRFGLDMDALEVTDEACLLLENIKVKGFDIGDRFEGFDLHAAEYLIKDLAAFHAVPIGLKMTHPDIFKTKVRDVLVNHITGKEIPDEMGEEMIKVIMQGAEMNRECAKYGDRILAALKAQKETYSKPFTYTEPFATMVHSDFWVNNTMLKLDSTGKPIANAMVDFQMISYASPADDLLFFIYSSLSTELIKEKYQHLVDLYYKTFIQVLDDLKVDTTPFKYELFLKEIERVAKSIQFFHIAFMFKPILTLKEKAKNLNDVNQNELVDNGNVADVYFPKLWCMIMDFVDRNWI